MVNEIVGKLENIEIIGIHNDIRVTVDGKEYFSEFELNSKKIPKNIRNLRGNYVKINYTESEMNVAEWLIYGIFNLGFDIPLKHREILKINTI